MDVSVNDRKESFFTSVQRQANATSLRCNQLDKWMLCSPMPPTETRESDLHNILPVNGGKPKFQSDLMLLDCIMG